VLACGEKRCSAWASATSAKARALDTLGAEWFGRFWQIACPEFGTGREIYRVGCERAKKLAEAIEHLSGKVREIRHLVFGAFFNEGLSSAVERFDEAYDALLGAAKAAAGDARQFLDTIGNQPPHPRLVARLRGRKRRRAWENVSDAELRDVIGLLVPRRSDFARAVFRAWPRAPSEAAGWAYFAIAAGIDPVPETAEEWDVARAVWRTEIRRARHYTDTVNSSG
jgi:hypothetical protein